MMCACSGHATMPTLLRRYDRRRWQCFDSLALCVLWRLARPLETGLLALLDARVAREEAGLAQRRAVLLVEREEGARDPVRNRVGPGADAAACHLGEYVEGAGQLHDLQTQAGVVFV